MKNVVLLSEVLVVWTSKFCCCFVVYRMNEKRVRNSIGPMSEMRMKKPANRKLNSMNMVVTKMEMLKL